MNILYFSVQGSEAAPYKITFKKTDGNFSAYCTCAAGENGMYCKHRFALLNGDITGLVGDNSNDILTVKEWLVDTDVERAMQEVLIAEQKLDAAKAQLTMAKKNLARSMRD
jgi:uncharacterized Zn finger protein